MPASNELNAVNPVTAHAIGTRLGETAKRFRASSRAHVPKRMPCQKRGMYQAIGFFTVRSWRAVLERSVVTLMKVQYSGRSPGNRAPLGARAGRRAVHRNARTAVEPI